MSRTMDTESFKIISFELMDGCHGNRMQRFHEKNTQLTLKIL